MGGENTTYQDSTTERVRGLPAGRLLRLVVVTLGLLAVTALASRQPLRVPGRSGGSAAGGVQINVSPWELALIGGGAAIAFIGVAVYAGWTSRKRTQVPFRRRSLLVALLLLSLWIGGILVAGGLAGGGRQSLPPPRGRLPVASQHSASPGSSFSVPVWVPWAVLGTLLGGALVVVVGAKTRGRAGEPETLPTAMDSAVTAALVDLETVTDPRRAIIAAYRRMEQSLAAAGFPRAAAEAPREYLGHVAGALEIDPKPLGTLTGLFELAKFSLRQFDPADRQRAISALHAVQMQLA